MEWVEIISLFRRFNENDSSVAKELAELMQNYKVVPVIGDRKGEVKWNKFNTNKEYTDHYFNIHLEATNSSGFIKIESKEAPDEEYVFIDMKTAKLLVQCFKEMHWMEDKKEQLVKIFESWNIPEWINEFCLDSNYEKFLKEIEEVLK